VRGRSVPGRVMSVHQGMRVTRAWKFSRQDWVNLAIYTAELVLPIFESRFPDDNRPRTAIGSGSAADAADAAGSAANIGARSAAHAARAAVAAADAMTRKADAAAYAAQAVSSADGAAHDICAAARTDVHTAGISRLEHPEPGSTGRRRGDPPLFPGREAGIHQARRGHELPMIEASRCSLRMRDARPARSS
jgi:hypothetical protein